MIKNIIRSINRKRMELSDYINNGNDEIGRTNLHILRSISRQMVIFSVLFLLITPILLNQWKVSIYHFILFGIAVFYMVLSEYMSYRQIYGKRQIRLAISSFMILTMMAFLLLDTIPYPEASEVFVVVLLVAAPSLFVVPFGPMLAFQILFLVAFFIMADQFKDPGLVSADCFEAMYGAVVGIGLYFVIMKVRIHDYSMKSIYKISSEVDFLTKIDNRATSKNKIEQYLAMKEDKSSCAMIVLDVDHFKEVNDRYGHETGDKVLRAVADILKQVFRSGDIIGRYGGDEFIVFLKDIKNEEILELKCAQIRETVNKVRVEDAAFSCSMGVCVIKEGNILPETIFNVADEALYRAKNKGRDTYVIKEARTEDKMRTELPLMVIVDDNIVDRETIGIQFENKYRMAKFSNCEEALMFMKNNETKISVILLDMIMPGVDGFALLREIRKRPQMADIPVIAISSDLTIKERVCRCGAQDLIAKPIVSSVARMQVANVMQNR